MPYNKRFTEKDIADMKKVVDFMILLYRYRSNTQHQRNAPRVDEFEYSPFKSMYDNDPRVKKPRWRLTSTIETSMKRYEDDLKDAYIFIFKKGTNFYFTMDLFNNLLFSRRFNVCDTESFLFSYYQDFEKKMLNVYAIEGAHSNLTPLNIEYNLKSSSTNPGRFDFIGNSTCCWGIISLAAFKCGVINRNQLNFFMTDPSAVIKQGSIMSDFNPLPGALACIEEVGNDNRVWHVGIVIKRHHNDILVFSFLGVDGFEVTTFKKLYNGYANDQRNRKFKHVLRYAPWKYLKECTGIAREHQRNINQQPRYNSTYTNINEFRIRLPSLKITIIMAIKCLMNDLVSALGGDTTTTKTLTPVYLRITPDINSLQRKFFEIGKYVKEGYERRIKKRYNNNSAENIAKKVFYKNINEVCSICAGRNLTQTDIRRCRDLLVNVHHNILAYVLNKSVKKNKHSEGLNNEILRTIFEYTGV
ncbi:MAG: hypothetical protein GY756_01500 [bacterium]|nr:hypothetical protein [bacterium]